MSELTRDADSSKKKQAVADTDGFENATLLTRVERLEAQRPVPSQSWLSPKVIALLASLVAAVVPATTALQTWLKNRSDLALSKQQQDHAMRMDYVKTVLSSEATEQDRESRLRLLIAILDPEDRLTDWARNELDATKARIEDLEQQVKAATEEALAAKEKQSEAEKKLTELQETHSPAEIAPGTTNNSNTQAAARITHSLPPAVRTQIEEAQVQASAAQQRATIAVRRARKSAEALGDKMAKKQLDEIESM
jgi:hypothetical protein